MPVAVRAGRFPTVSVGAFVVPDFADFAVFDVFPAFAALFGDGCAADLSDGSADGFGVFGIRGSYGRARGACSGSAPLLFAPCPPLHCLANISVCCWVLSA